MNNRDSKTNTLRVFSFSMVLMIGMLLSSIGYGGQIQPGQKQAVPKGEGTQD